MRLMELFLFDGAFAITIVAAALAMSSRGRGLGRFALPLALVFLLGYSIVPTRSVLSFGVSLLLVGIIYQWRPFKSAIPLACALLVNPFLRYFDALAGFELRLWLTESVGRMLSMVGQEVEVVGNVLWLSGQPFSVDAECVGIYLMLTALAVSVLCLALAEHQAKRVFRMPIVVSVIGLSFMAVIAANLMRILVLVVTGWGPDHFMHGTVGLLAFAGYLLLPTAIGTRWLVNKSWATVPWVQLTLKPLSTSFRTPWKLARLVLVPMLAIGLIVFQSHGEVKKLPHKKTIVGTAPEQRANGVLGYSFADAIVYIKPIPAFYLAEHSPTICWRGSGYQFSQIELTMLSGGGEVFTARLVQDEVVLYTAWWMDNGTIQTLDQGDWRRRMAVGEHPFHLINVTANNANDLKCWINELYGHTAINVSSQ